MILRLLTLATASFHEIVRRPVFLLLLAGGVVFIITLGNLSYFALGDEARLVKQSVLAFMLVAGLLSAVLSAAASVSREITSGTALTVLSKPIGRTVFILSKFGGLAAALTLQVGVHLVAALLAGRMAYEVSGHPDWLALAVVVLALIGALLIGAAANFFAHRPFVSTTVFATTVLLVLALIFIQGFSREGQWAPGSTALDWRLVPAGVLILYALLVLGGFAVALSTRLDLLPTLCLCVGLFLLGLLSDYIFGRAAAGGSTVAGWVHALLPNWQLFWMADTLADQKRLPWSYVVRATAYVAAHLFLSLSLALALFEDRELS